MKNRQGSQSGIPDKIANVLNALPFRFRKGAIFSTQYGRHYQAGYHLNRSIRRWKPRRKSTGPKSAAGKQRSSQNAVKHGAHSGDLEEAQKLFREAWRD